MLGDIRKVEHIYIACGYTDLRRGIDGLAQIVQNQFSLDADEILTREDFLTYNELYSKRIEEYDRKITELEAEQQNLQTAPNAYPFLDVYRKYRKLEEITRPMVVELIEKIEVYEGNRVEITFRFQDEIADLLEELHQKQMGQHEVSA